MRQKVADEASMPLDAVEATATAGSVTIAFTVNMQSEAAADTALTAITAKLTDKTAASTFLSTPANPVTVEEIVAPTKLVLVSPSPSPPPPSDLLDPPFGSSTLACNDADSKLYTNTSGWVEFSLVCGLTCGVGAMLAGPNCVSHTGLEPQTSRQVPCRAATHTFVSPALDRLLPVCATRCLSVVPTVHDALELRPFIRPLLCCLPCYRYTTPWKPI